jgi:SAM-dependent methyltransferase
MGPSRESALKKTETDRLSIIERRSKRRKASVRHNSLTTAAQVQPGLTVPDAPRTLPPPAPRDEVRLDHGRFEGARGTSKSAGAWVPFGRRAVDLSNLSTLTARAYGTLRARGARYTLHKVFRRSLSPWPGLKRRLVYRSPREYWTLRGGDDYFREQEGQFGRSLRAEWLAERIARLKPESVLEVGCGYGKQLLEIRRLLDVPLFGVDFSPSQLRQATHYLAGQNQIELALASGDSLPFVDGAFDLVLTSAVILHNPPPAAERIRREVIRVARRWAAHNEETDVSYNRFGYDTAAWYRSAGIPLAECVPIPADLDPTRSQFCVAELWRR